MLIGRAPYRLSIIECNFSVRPNRDRWNEGCGCGVWRLPCSYFEARFAAPCRHRHRHRYQAGLRATVSAKNAVPNCILINSPAISHQPRSSRAQQRDGSGIPKDLPLSGAGDRRHAQRVACYHHAERGSRPVFASRPGIECTVADSASEGCSQPTLHAAVLVMRPWRPSTVCLDGRTQAMRDTSARRDLRSSART